MSNRISFTISPKCHRSLNYHAQTRHACSFNNPPTIPVAKTDISTHYAVNCHFLLTKKTTRLDLFRLMANVILLSYQPDGLVTSLDRGQAAAAPYLRLASPAQDAVNGTHNTHKNPRLLGAQGDSQPEDSSRRKPQFIFIPAGIPNGK